MPSKSPAIRIDLERALARGLSASLLGIAALTLGCGSVGYRALTPATSAELSSIGPGVAARVERIRAPFWGAGTRYHIDVSIENGGKENLHVAPGCLDLDLVGPPGDVPTLPLAVFPLASASVLEGEKDLAPGESGTYRLEVDGAPLENGGRYVLGFDRALSVAQGTLAPLPIVKPGAPHLGYGSPADPTFIFVGHLGGGAIRVSSVTAGLGGLELYFGPQFGKLSVGAYAMLGVGSVGGEVRYRIEPARWISIVPFAGYGYYHIVGVLGLNAGHGPRAGLEVDFSTGKVTHFGWARSGGRIGVFAHVGPAFLRAVPETGVAAQGGMSFGFF